MQHGHKRTSSEQRHDFKSLRERMDRWKPPSGPFDWETRGKAVTETHQFYNEAFQFWKRNPHDGELSELHSRAIKLWRQAISAAYPPGFWDNYMRLKYRRDERDFRAFCRLARKVDVPELRQALAQRLTHTDSNVRRRARWILDALEQPR